MSTIIIKQINYFAEELPCLFKTNDEFINKLVRLRWFKWTVVKTIILNITAFIKMQ